MKYILLILALVCSVTASNATTPIAKDLEGIWETDGSEFRGEALIKGKAIYLDRDGVGAAVGAPDYSTCIGIQIVVTSWNGKVLKIDLIDNGKVVGSESLKYNSHKKVFISSTDSKESYHRRSTTMSAAIKGSLGLEPKAKQN